MNLVFEALENFPILVVEVLDPLLNSPAFQGYVVNARMWFPICEAPLLLGIGQ